jgi:flavin-binding protein dodecin
VAEPFERRPAATGLGRLAGNRRACMREIEDLLAQAPRVRDVKPEQVASVAGRHDVDLATQLATSRRDLYRRLLAHCLTDQVLSAEESAEVEHLRRLLALSVADIDQVHDQVARSIYGQAIDRVLADHRVDAEEREFLRRLGGTLALDEAARERLDEEGVQRARQRFLERTLAHDSALVASSGRVIELTGSSGRSLEDAIRSALEEAARAVPELRDFEVTRIHGSLEGGSVARWQVSLRASFGAAE